MTNATSGRIKRTSKRSRIKQAIVGWIQEQGLKHGDCLLGQTQFAELLNTTPLTIQRAMTELSAEGVVHRRKGAGTFVGADPSVNRIRSIGLVLPSEQLDSPTHNPRHWPYVQDLYRSFLGAIGENWQFSSVVISRETPPEQAIERLTDFDAVFFHHTKEPIELWRHVARKSRIPTVAFGVAEADTPCLTLDESPLLRTRSAIAYLVSRGYRKIMPVCSKHWGDRWLQGFMMAISDHGLVWEETDALRVGVSRTDVIDAVNQQVDDGLNCDAILADTDLTALNTIETLQHRGISVPGDIGVMGQSGLDMAIHFPPFLTTVESAYPTMIAYALRELESATDGTLPSRYKDFGGNVLPGKTTR